MNRRAGFTLVELVVVVTVVALLLAMLMPTLGRARDMSQKAVCSSRLKQYAVAVSGYLSDYQSYPHFAPNLDAFTSFDVDADGDGNSDRAMLEAFPKFYSLLEQLQAKGTARTSWGVPVYFWQVDQIWSGALCPAVDAGEIVDKWAKPLGAKSALHPATVAYSWNPALRSKTPAQDGDGNWLLTRMPAAYVVGNEIDALNWTKGIDVRLFRPDGTACAAQAVNRAEIDDPAHVAEAWDSCDLDTTPDPGALVGDARAENLLPGWHCGPQSADANGWAMLNGARHPSSPNILYADGSVRSDAGRRLTAAEVGNKWANVRANSWDDWDDQLGTIHHLLPRRRALRP